MNPAVSTVRGRVAVLHTGEAFISEAGALQHMEPIDPALVIGSTQRLSLESQQRCSTAGVDVVRRRSGGSAVFVSPGDLIWIDVVLPRRHPLWDDDVVRSSWWLGEAWCRALAGVGLPGLEGAELLVHRSGLERSKWSGEVCFAGLGAGEVTIDGRKIVGMSQRRNRFGARFQSMLVVRDRTETVIELLGLGERAMGDIAPSITDLCALTGGDPDLRLDLAPVVGRVRRAVETEVVACLAMARAAG